MLDDVLAAMLSLHLAMPCPRVLVLPGVPCIGQSAVQVQLAVTRVSKVLVLSATDAMGSDYERSGGSTVDRVARLPIARDLFQTIRAEG